jgi:hypothetical protein
MHLRPSQLSPGVDRSASHAALPLAVAAAVLLILTVCTTAARGQPRERPGAGNRRPGPARTAPGAPAPASPRSLESNVTTRLPAGVLQNAWWVQHGGKIHLGDPSKPAVLLFHGLHRTGRCWTAPSKDGEGVYHFDYKNEPRTLDLGTQSYPGVGVYKIGANTQTVEVDPDNWFDFLAGRGFTVATFTQPGLDFDDAVPTAVEALAKFEEQTRAMKPDAPPPIALVCHSRGGLVGRAVMKQHGSMSGRVKWFVTLSTPHQGSELARAPHAIEQEIRRSVDEALAAATNLPSEVPLPVLRNSAEDVVVTLMRPLLWMANRELNDEDRELKPGGTVITSLEQGEQKLDGVEYHTFGGTNPNYFRMCVYMFTGDSAKLNAGKFKWSAYPIEVGAVSPMFEDVRDFCAEITPGKGDGLVADARARLPWSKHESVGLNHAEFLWDRALQRRVARLLTGVDLADLAESTRLPVAAAGTAGGGAPDFDELEARAAQLEQRIKNLEQQLSRSGRPAGAAPLHEGGTR